MSPRPYVIHAGVMATISARRRYGHTTFTWVTFEDATGATHHVDPWPCVRPKKAEVMAECQRIAGATRRAEE